MDNLQNKSQLNQISKFAEEVAKIRNPQLKTQSEQILKNIINKIYINKKAKNLHDALSPKSSFETTTARNKQLINYDEQVLLKNSTVAFFGLSVGSHAAVTWMMLSRANKIKISDPDTIDASNLNRLRTGWKNIGAFKTDIIKQELIDINPDIETYDFKSKDETIVNQIITENPLPCCIVDEIDDFKTKILLRKLAKKLKLPLISAADVGDNVMIDVERYDLNPQPQLFLGKIPNIENLDFSKLTNDEKNKLIINHIGFDLYSEKMIESIYSIKGSIPTWPQLGSTATIAGGIIATLIKKIILNEKVPSGRYLLSIDKLFEPKYTSKSFQNILKSKINDLKNVIKKN